MIIGALEAGGTKMVCAIGNEKGEIFDRISIPTRDPEVTIPEMVEYFNSKGIEALGIGCFGPICVNEDSEDYGKIFSTPKLAWKNFNIYKTMKDACNVPVMVDTDVNGSALGEATFGCAKGLKDVCYLTIGTGIGMGVIAEGRLLHGNLHSEAGHIKVRRRSDDSFEGCCPYHKDCVEGLAAGPALGARWNIPGAEIPYDHKAWDLEAYYIAEIVATYICALAPSKVILGGGVMHNEQLFPMIRKYVKEIIGEYITTPEMMDIDNYIVPYSLNDNQGIMGCLELGRRAAEKACK